VSSRYVPDFDMSGNRNIKATDLLFVAKQFGPC